MLKVKESSGIFHWISKAFSAGRSPIKSEFLTPFLLWSLGIDISSFLLLEMNFLNEIHHSYTCLQHSLEPLQFFIINRLQSVIHIELAPPYFLPIPISIVCGSFFQGIVWITRYSTKYTGTHCKSWWFLIYVVIFPPQELDEWLLVFSNPQLLVHGL